MFTVRTDFSGAGRDVWKRLLRATVPVKAVRRTSGGEGLAASELIDDGAGSDEGGLKSLIAADLRDSGRRPLAELRFRAGGGRNF
jgi:hypothetical protein